MKYNNLTLILFTLLVISFSSCDKNEIPPIGDPSSKVLGIQDDWTLTKVVQVDLLTPFNENSMDVSSVFIGDTPAAMNFDANNYTINYGSSPEGLLGTGGTWAFDDNDYPTNITLTSNGETFIVDLNRTVRETDTTLEFELKRVCGGIESISYKYIFAR